MIRRVVPTLLVGVAVTAGCGADPAAHPAADPAADPSRPGPAESAAPCDVPAAGPVTVEQLREGSSVVGCDAVGRTVVWRGVGVTVPRPGQGLDLFAEPVGPGPLPSRFGISVSETGIVSYRFDDGRSSSGPRGIEPRREQPGVRRSL